MHWWFISFPFIAAATGWLINRLLITLLFRPYHPVKISGITLQGVFPKKQAQLAAGLSKQLSTQLFSFRDIEEKITSPENLQQVLPLAEQHVDHFLRHKLGEAFPMISMFIGDTTINQLKTIFMQELAIIFPEVMQAYMKNLQQKFDPEQMIAQKIAAISPAQLELTLRQAMTTEFRTFRIAGAVTGFLIGLIQLIVISLIN